MSPDETDDFDDENYDDVDETTSIAGDRGYIFKNSSSLPHRSTVHSRRKRCQHRVARAESSPTRQRSRRRCGQKRQRHWQSISAYFSVGKVSQVLHSRLILIRLWQRVREFPPGLSCRRVHISSSHGCGNQRYIVGHTCWNQQKWGLTQFSVTDESLR
jgi:hypothetical protein